MDENYDEALANDFPLGDWLPEDDTEWYPADDD